MSLLEKIDLHHSPAHVAIIMDGNGRWAQKRGEPREKGHKEGVVAVRKIVEAASQAKVKYLTLYTFSTENWNRPQKEVEALMELVVFAVAQETADLLKNGVRLMVIGDLQRLPERVRNVLLNCIEQTAGGKTITLVLALSYSARWEITEATRQLVRAVEAGEVNRADIDEDMLGNYLTTRYIPDPDLLIRTGGEQRISNFLLWQAAYAELYFTETFWPDFNAESLYEAIVEYQQRERRFGKTSEQLESI